LRLWWRRGLRTPEGVGLVDASVVALAEEIGVVRLATRDVRHFEAVRLRSGRRFELVVRPRRPER
jgi:predicted nucleic acid-binding protein